MSGLQRSEVAWVTDSGMPDEDCLHLLTFCQCSVFISNLKSSASSWKKELSGGRVFSHRIDTACTSQLKRCSQTFGRKPCFAENIPVWLCSSSAFYWGESTLKLTCKGCDSDRQRSQMKIQYFRCTWKSKAFLGLDAGLQFAELLPSVQVIDHHFFHSASLQTEQSFFQTPRSHENINRLLFHHTGASRLV